MPNGCLALCGPDACKAEDYLRVLHSVAGVDQEANELKESIFGIDVSSLLAGVEPIFPHH